MAKLVFKQAQKTLQKDFSYVVRKEHDVQCKLFKRLYDVAGPTNLIKTVKSEMTMSMQNGGAHITERRCDIILNDTNGASGDLIVELKLGASIQLTDVGQVVEYMRRHKVPLGVLIYFPKDGGFSASIKAAYVYPDSTMQPLT